MQERDKFRVGHVLNYFPLYTETFIVNEVIANEEAGFRLIFFR